MLSESNSCKMLQKEIHKTIIFHEKRGKKLKTAFVKHHCLLRDMQWGGLLWDLPPKGNVDSVEERRKNFTPRWYESLWSFCHYLHLWFQAVRRADCFCDTSRLIKHFTFFLSKITAGNLHQNHNTRCDSSFISTALRRCEWQG